MRISLRARITWAVHLSKACLKQYHRELLRPLSAFIATESVVFDVGAHAGQFTKLFAKMVPQGHVYSFEPGSYALSILRAAVRFHGLGNVTVLPFGLGDRDAQLRLSVPVKPSGSIGFGLSHLNSARSGPTETWAGSSCEEETVEIRTADGFIREHGVGRLDFIKVDIEGWELRMLTGAAETLRRFAPSILTEVNDSHLGRAGDSAESLFAYLRSLGYRAFACDRSGAACVELYEPDCEDIFFCKREAHIARLLAL